MKTKTPKQKERNMDKEYKRELWYFLGDYFDKRFSIVRTRHERLIAITERAIQEDRNNIVKNIERIKNSIEIGADPIDYLNDLIHDLS